MKNLRDSAQTPTDAQTWLQVSQATGAKFDDYIAETSPAGMATDLSYVKQLAAEGIAVALILVRRPALEVSAKPVDWALALLDGPLRAMPT